MEVYNASTAPPNQVLGYTINSRTRIYVSYIIPSTLATLLYIAQFVADCSVTYEFFHNHELIFGGATLSLILIPPVLTFILILSSKSHWINCKNPSRLRFIGINLLRLVLFPLFTLYRFAFQIFWSIEALFQSDNDVERMQCLDKATECHTCELYLFIQAYAQAAPQIILQMYYMFNQDMFRNYQTSTAQAICLVFSAIDLAMITTSYHRFESQRQVGRAYPWSTPDQIEAQRRLLDCDSRLRNECACRKRESERTLTRFPQSDKIMENFNTRMMESGKYDTDDKIPKSHSVQVHSFDEVDNDNDGEFLETTALVHREKNSTSTKIGSSPANVTDDDKIKDKPKLHIGTNNALEPNDDITIIDTIPDTPPPPLPTLIHVEQRRPESRSSFRNTTQYKRSSNIVQNQLETFKDMLIVNAQLYIKEHLPHPPKLFIQRVENQEKEYNQKSTSVPSPMPDETDFFLPRPTKVINGIQQEDIAAKTVAFFGWIAFILMRMLSLATFCFFYPRAFFIIVSVHYIVMLLALCFESRFKGISNIALFYIVLAYVYIFVLLEFRVKFKRVRLWITGYFIITMIENISMTATWYSKEDFESWWFGFIAESITYSGILFISTLIVYYFLLKPKDVTLIVEDNDK